MSRREELEKEIALMDEQIKNAPADTPPGRIGRLEKRI